MLRARTRRTPYTDPAALRRFGQLDLSKGPLAKTTMDEANQLCTLKLKANGTKESRELLTAVLRPDYTK